MKQYIVKIPIAGHFVVEVEAEDEAEAINKAWDTDTSGGEAEWEMLSAFNSGNVCHCPSPWNVEAEEA